MPADDDFLPFTPEDLLLLAGRADRGTDRVERIEIAGRPVWIKRPATGQATAWHRAQRALSFVAPHPMLRVTVDPGGPASIERERRRIERFRHAGFLVPPVLYASSRSLVLGDIGENIGGIRKKDGRRFSALLPLVGETLGRVHAAGLVHGRPSQRDLTASGERIGFIDFEEDPEAVMPLVTAQARDLWLLFIDFARAGLDDASMEAVFSTYRPFLTTERRQALAAVLSAVVRLSRIVEPAVRPFAGRDLTAPIAASRFLQGAFRRALKGPAQGDASGKS